MVLIESEETASVLETPELHRKFLNVRYAECTEDEVMDIYLPEQGPVSCNCGHSWRRVVLRSKKFTEDQAGAPGA